jgi:hypothetical protein
MSGVSHANEHDDTVVEDDNLTYSVEEPPNLT